MYIHIYIYTYIYIYIPTYDMPSFHQTPNKMKQNKTAVDLWLCPVTHAMESDQTSLHQILPPLIRRERDFGLDYGRFILLCLGWVGLP